MYTVTPINKTINIDSLAYVVDATRPKNYYFSGEMHDFWEAVLVYSGTATATADERIYNLTSGKLLFHKPMEFHRIWTGNDNDAHLKIISFCASGDGMKYFENGCFILNDAETEAFSRITQGFMQNIGTEKSNKESSSHSISPSLTAALLEVFLLELSEKAKLQNSPLSHSEKQYRNIVKVMKENCDKFMSLDKIAELCHMSTSNMKRVFKIYSDIGPAKYFMTLKMRRATELLGDGMPVSDIATTLGFDEICYFYTAFKREYGITPSQYRAGTNI